MVKIKVARGTVRWLILFMGKINGIRPRAFTSFWDTIYVMNKKDLNNKKIIKHELKHIEQINRECIIAFTFKFIYYNIRYGYWNNPYEVEARKAM